MPLLLIHITTDWPAGTEAGITAPKSIGSIVVDLDPVSYPDSLTAVARTSTITTSAKTATITTSAKTATVSPRS